MGLDFFIALLLVRGGWLDDTNNIHINAAESMYLCSMFILTRACPNLCCFSYGTVS